VIEDLIDLVDWRRRVGDLYRIGGPDAITEFRRRRDELFKSHSQSPIEPDERSTFTGLEYFSPDPAYRVTATLEEGSGDELVIETGGADGAIHYRRAGRIVFDLLGQRCALTVLSLHQYAGGLFLPFKDATSGKESYGAARYIDLKVQHDDVYLFDFNYAYNPYCAYNEGYACPLPPAENSLKVAIRAGEKKYHE